MKTTAKIFSPIIWVSHEINLSGANYSLLEFMQEMKEAGAKQLLVVHMPGTMSERAIMLGFDVVFIKSYGWVRHRGEPFFNNGFFKRLVRNQVAFFKFLLIFMQHRPKLVVSFTSTTYIAALASSMAGIRHYYRISEFGEKDFGFRLAWGKWAYAFMNAVSDKILVNSKAVFEQYVQFIKPDKIAVVYNSVHLNRPIERKQASDRGKASRLLLMGQIIPSKGHLDALEALVYLREKGLFPVLTIAGKQIMPEYVSELDSFIEMNNLCDQVKFVNFTPDKELLLEECDILLMCSVSEAFGRVTAEAMKAMEPVIGADAGGTKELIIHGVTGLLYQPGNARELAARIEAIEMGIADAVSLAENAFRHINDLTSAANRLKYFCLTD